MEPEPRPTTSDVVILLVSGTCCVPQLAVADQHAHQVIHQALQETGITAQVRTSTISSALNGGIPIEILKSIGLAMDGSNIMRLPAVFINNRFISLGIPKLDVIKDALTSIQK